MLDAKRILVGGDWRTSDRRMPVHFPLTDEILCHVSVASDEDLEEAVQRALRGFEITRKLPAHARNRILLKLAEQMDKRTDELVETLILEGGKARKWAVAEVARSKETIRVSAEEAERVGGELVPMDWTESGEKRMGLVRRFPLGVVLAIAPFNYPLNLACHKLGPAIAAGNAVILKPASATPLSALLLGEMALEAGLPPEALSVLVCPGAKAEKLVGDPRIAFLTFTGSSQVGWHLKSLSGRKRAGLELGGNAAAIVHEDANLEYAASRITMGGFANAGQNCISVQRVLLHRPIYRETLDRLIGKIGALKVGDPRDLATDVGPMIDRRAAADAFAVVQQAVKSGAQIALGGECDQAMFHPTVLVNTTPEMAVNHQEIFAPVITVTPYDDFEQAIRMANDTDYGLQAGVFTRDIGRIMRAFEAIEVGGLQINDVSTFRMDQMPYGGVKSSGIGREGPRYAVEEMTEPKLMVLNMNA